MALYKITYDKRVQKEIRKINKSDVETIVVAIRALAQDPYPKLSKKLIGSNSRSLRVRNYRVLYKVDENVITIRVIRVGHRKDVYRDV